MREFYVPWSREKNIDETAVRQTSSADRGWAKRCSKTNFYVDAKTVVTLTLACCTDGGPILQQIVMEEKTQEVEPKGPLAEFQEVTYTPTHWCNTDALILMLKQIDNHVQQGCGDNKLPWICCLDCARQHIASAFREAVKDTLPWVHLVHIQPNTTGFDQSLDIVYMILKCIGALF